MDKRTIMDRDDKIRIFTFFVCLILCLFVAIKCHSQVKIDTIPCNAANITKYVMTDDGKRVYAVYNDKQHGISEIIPVSKSVYEYIVLCEQNGIKPSLAIRLKNNQIFSIIKFKRKYKLLN